MIEPMLFSTDCQVVGDAIAGGATGVVIDWESAGKRARQEGADTQIGTDTLQDLRRVRACTQARILCRTDRHGPDRCRHIELAITNGADEILIPMVRTVADAEAALDQAAGRVGVGILIETEDAVRAAGDLARLPLSRVYVGLNDLAIDRGSACIFDALADGTVEDVRRHFKVPFGFGGLTLPDRGSPIPCRLLMREMIRLGCGFSFLRRSFHRDANGIAPSAAVRAILDAIRCMDAADAEERARDRRDLLAAISAWPPSRAPGYRGAPA